MMYKKVLVIGHNPDIILLDILDPDKDGFETLISRINSLMEKTIGKRTAN